MDTQSLLSEKCDRLISQLDNLVIFMGLSRTEVFQTVRNKWPSWYEADKIEFLFNEFPKYEQVILQSALLLGVSYVEAYLADILRDILCAKPQVLVSRNKTVEWKDIVQAGSYDQVMGLIIEREVNEFTRQSHSAMMDYFAKQLKISVPEGPEMTLADEASLVRNCITHNGSKVSVYLASRVHGWTEGYPIELTESKVHEYGLAARFICRLLDAQIMQKFSLPVSGR